MLAILFSFIFNVVVTGLVMWTWNPLHLSGGFQWLVAYLFVSFLMTCNEVTQIAQRVGVYD